MLFSYSEQNPNGATRCLVQTLNFWWHQHNFNLRIESWGRSIECPNKSARFKVRCIVVLLGWRHWNFNICHLSFLRLVVIERYTKGQRVIIVKNVLQNLLQNYILRSYWDTPYKGGFSIVKDTPVDHNSLKFIHSNVNSKTNVCHYWGALQRNYNIRQISSIKIGCTDDLGS